MNKNPLFATLLISSLTLMGCNSGSGSSTPEPITTAPPTTPTTPPTTVSPGTSQLNALLEQRVFNAAEVSGNGGISVELDANAVCELLTVKTDNEQAGMGVTQIRAPDGSILYSAEVGEEGLTNVVSEFFDDIGGEGELAVFLPPTPMMTLEAGTYEFTVVREDDAALSDVRAFVKSNPEGSSIDDANLAYDLNVWVAHPDSAFSAEAFQNTVRNDYVDVINSILEDHNLAINEVNFFTATQAETSQFASLDVDNEYSAACRAMLAVSGAGLSLNLAFVQELTSEDTPGIAGVSSSPGLINDASAGESCFFVAQTAYVANPAEGLSEMQAIASQAGNILHEGSHFMSLQHTTEENGQKFDRFDDTAQCDAMTFDGRDNPTFDVAGELDGEMSDHECSFEGGANNVLFYAGHQDFLPYQMSADQAWVMRRHPLALPVSE